MAVRCSCHEKAGYHREKHDEKLTEKETELNTVERRLTDTTEALRLQKDLRVQGMLQQQVQDYLQRGLNVWPSD